MVSLKDIAAICGVSAATVSKALNNSKEVSPATRERIVTTAAELGYLPRTARRNRAVQCSCTLALLYAGDDGDSQTRESRMAFLEGFWRTAKTAGYDLTLMNDTVFRGSPMSYLAHARSSGFDGICILCADLLHPGLEELASGDIPVVTVNQPLAGCPCVYLDDQDGMCRLLRYAFDCGHRRIAFVYSLSSAAHQARLFGFREAAVGLGLPLPDEYLRETPIGDADGVYEQTLLLLELPLPPTCIVYSDDSSAIIGLNALHVSGLRVPEDLSIAGYGGIPQSRYLTPHLTTIFQDAEALGAAAAALLTDQIAHPEAMPGRQQIIHGTLQRGGTIRPI